MHVSIWIAGQYLVAFVNCKNNKHICNVFPSMTRAVICIRITESLLNMLISKPNPSPIETEALEGRLWKLCY